MNAEARAITKPRRSKAFADKERTLFLEARKARLAGDTARRAFILRERMLPEQLSEKRRGRRIVFGKILDRTFVSDIELDNGAGNWHGYDYFGDVQFADWPEREKLGVGGRDLSRRKR